MPPKAVVLNGVTHSLENKIGSGAVSDVWAVAPVEGRMALCLHLPKSLTATPTTYDQEAAMLTKIHDWDCVSGMGHVDGRTTPVLLTPRAPGIDLYQFLASETVILPTKESAVQCVGMAVDYLNQVCMLISERKSRGMDPYLLDLKYENVIVRYEDSRVTCVDVSEEKKFNAKAVPHWAIAEERLISDPDLLSKIDIVQAGRVLCALLHPFYSGHKLHLPVKIFTLKQQEAIKRFDAHVVQSMLRVNADSHLTMAQLHDAATELNGLLKAAFSMAATLKTTSLLCSAAGAAGAAEYQMENKDLEALAAVIKDTVSDAGQAVLLGQLAVFSKKIYGERLECDLSALLKAVQKLQRVMALKPIPAEVMSAPLRLNAYLKSSQSAIEKEQLRRSSALASFMALAESSLFMACVTSTCAMSL
jgi:hypothetical protein